MPHEKQAYYNEESLVNLFKQDYTSKVFEKKEVERLVNNLSILDEDIICINKDLKSEQELDDYYESRNYKKILLKRG
jgi:hypothetical protein